MDVYEALYTTRAMRRVKPDPIPEDVQKKILDDFREKYWQNRLLGIGPSRAEFDNGNRVAIVITPIRDLPGGFAPAPGTSPPPLEMPATVPGKAP